MEDKTLGFIIYGFDLPQEVIKNYKDGNYNHGDMTYIDKSVVGFIFDKINKNEDCSIDVEKANKFVTELAEVNEEIYIAFMETVLQIWSDCIIENLSKLDTMEEDSDEYKLQNDYLETLYMPDDLVFSFYICINED